MKPYNLLINWGT